MLQIPEIHSMPVVDVEAVMDHLIESGDRHMVVWQERECMAFIARGREYRSEFHINPTHEVMYSLRGDNPLHYRDENGKEHVTVIPEGSCIYQREGVPHSPRFPADAFLFVFERMRRPGEVDRFHWFCPSCDGFLHEETFIVDDYRKDPVSVAYRNFFESTAFRTCKACGTVMPAEEM